MITVTVEQKRGAVTRRVRVTAPSIERALQISGHGKNGTEARVVFPIDGEAFFAHPAAPEGIDFGSMTTEEVEAARDAGLPGADEAFLEAVKDDLGAEAFKVYALHNGLV